MYVDTLDGDEMQCIRLCNFHAYLQIQDDWVCKFIPSFILHTAYYIIQFLSVIGSISRFNLLKTLNGKSDQVRLYGKVTDSDLLGGDMSQKI